MPATSLNLPLTIEVFDRKNRWSNKNLEVCRARKMAKPRPGATLADYHVHGATFDPTRLTLPKGLSEEEWMLVGRKVQIVAESSQWWVADWLLYGFDNFGKNTAYTLAQQVTGYPKGTLYSWVSVARAVPPERRVTGLGFHKHSAIAALPAAHQEKVLAEAAELGLSETEILATARQIRGLPPPKDAARKTVTIHLWNETFDKLKRYGKGKSMSYVVANIVEAWARSHDENL